MASRKMKEEISEINKESQKSMNSEEMVMEAKRELQTMWKVPATAQFVSLCRFCFKLPEIEIEELEDGLLQTSEVGRKVLLDLLVGLLRSLRPQRGINHNNFEVHLQKQLTRIKATGECLNVNLTEEVTFSKLDITSKVDLLYSLCESRLDRADVAEAMKDMDAEALRVQPLGSDELGNEYWYFYGTRLYKQEPSTEKKKDWREEWVEQKNQSFTKRGRGRPRKNASRKSEHQNEFEEDKSSRKYMNIDEKSRWSVICNTIEDWVDLAQKFKKSKSKKEQALFATITDNFLPVLNEIYQEKERKFKEKLRELIPKAVPRRIETRRMTTRRTAEVDMNGFDSVNAHKEHLVRDRAHRLQERNRRASQVTNDKTRSRYRRSYIDEEDEYDDDDDFESFSQDTSRYYAPEEHRQELMPIASIDVTNLKAKVLHVLSEVKLQKDAWPFLHPVEESYAPGYYDIIQEPMDLSTISKKLMENSYVTIKDIDQDFEKMVSNCQLYNGEHSGVSKMVINLWKVFRTSLIKVFGSATQDGNSQMSNQTSSKFQQTDSDSQDSTYGKRKADSFKTKRKKRASHKNALETLSKEAQLAVEKSQNTEKMQVDMRESVSHPKQYSLYSDLKIVPINNHPAELIEKFSSDSSNQDYNDFDSFNDPSSPYGNQSSNSQSPNETNNLGTEVQVKPRSAPSIHFISQSDYTPEIRELIEKSSPKEFNILPDNDEANNDLPNSNLNTSVSSLSSHHSSSPDTSGHTRSPQNAVQNLPQPNSERTVPLLSDSFGINELSSFTSSFETSTVNASALGLTSTQTSFRKPVSSNQIPMTTSFGPNSQTPFATATSTPAQLPLDRSNLEPPRSSPIFSTQVPVPENQQLASQQNQVTKESAQFYQFQKSNIEIGFPSTSGVTFASQVPMEPVVTNSSAQIPLQVPVPYSKAFPNQNNLILQQQEGNKFPNVKFSLPPSTGEILLVPGDQASSSMTFHLFAQPSANPSQPIQSSLELKANNGNTNVGSLSNQQAVSTVERQGISNKVAIRDESIIRPQKRKSPLQDLLQPAVQATPVTTSLPSMPKISEPAAGFPGPVRFTDASSNFSSAYANSTNAGIRPLQRPQYNPATNTSISYSNEMSVLQASNIRSNAPLQQTGNMLPVPVAAQKTMPIAFPNSNKGFVSTNCNATTTNLVFSRPPNVAVKKIQLPNGTLAMNSNSIIQNANGQLVFIPSVKEPVQRPKGEIPKTQSSGKPLSSAVTCSPFLPSANNTMMQSFAFQNAPMNQSQVYTQVVPSQLQPQFINNNPYYIITDPNAFQNTQRYPVMNMQPISFTNR